MHAGERLDTRCQLPCIFGPVPLSNSTEKELCVCLHGRLAFSMFGSPVVGLKQ